MKIMRNLILCTLLLGSQALVAAAKKETGKKDVKDEAKGASKIPNLGAEAELALKDIQEHNKCSREDAYEAFLHFLHQFTLGQPKQNDANLAKHRKLSKISREKYKHIREAHRQLTQEQRKEIYDALGITTAEFEALEERYNAFPHGRIKEGKPKKAKKEKDETEDLV